MAPNPLVFSFVVRTEDAVHYAAESYECSNWVDPPTLPVAHFPGAFMCFDAQHLGQ